MSGASPSPLPAQDPPAGIGSIATSGSARPKRIWRGRAAWVVLVAVLLYWALRNAPLAQIWVLLADLRPWQAGALLLLNLFIYLLVTARWWLIVRAGGRRIAFLPLVGVRMSVFGISYFTLGPQVGGEPLQVLYLERKYGMPYTHATATVILDKLLEFLANFVLLAIGLTAVLREGIMSGNAGAATGLLIWLAALALLPPAYLLLLFNKMHPLSGLARLLPRARRGAAGPVRFLHAAERLAGRFCRRYPAALIASICASLLAAIGVVSEYALMTSFLQVHLPFWQIVAAWTAGWLAFLVPLPGGLGTLEASQVFALGAFGVPAASAIGVTLLIRGRDILIGGFGLLLAGGGLRRRESTRSKGEQP